ncbi:MULTISPECIES: class E sortase [unclassified Streptomyces]|uniref:class E sortase n=1 Tax=unclassified Streptomyces TaxID=2593676 RepID=UPI000566842D|nr:MULTISPECIES: class E sortase [unclassified Streptomyces]
MRLVVRTLSELSITVGALIVLFVCYVLFWTGVRANRAMDGEIDRLEDRWATGPVSVADPVPPGYGRPLGLRFPFPAPAAVPYRDGRAFAVMYVPRLGRSWHKPVLEGTGTGTLKKGLGHYANTARLGAVGNFAVAGQRRTYGDPFKDFPRLRKGDEVVLTDGRTRYTHEIDRAPYRTVPTDVAVIDPVPRKSGYTVPGRYLTLTTCDPEWGHSHRLITRGHLESTQPVEDGMPEGLSG